MGGGTGAITIADETTEGFVVIETFIAFLGSVLFRNKGGEAFEIFGYGKGDQLRT
jgi:hypothetical protein